MNTQKTPDDKLREAAEEWRDIEGYDSYQVSNLGNVKTTKQQRNTLLKRAISKHGYPMVYLYKDNVRKGHRIHRLVAQAFIPNAHNKPCVNHIDSDRLNAKLENLEWCTYSENSYHAVEFGRAGSGVKAPSAKLTAEQVVEIFHSVGSHASVAKKYGITYNSVYLIRYKKSYKKELINEYKQSKTNSDETNNS